jgi:BirA family biotin operon repressor/biotin-[acetyl-CoA-carboxylase] ligase
VGDEYRYDGWSAGELAEELGVPAVSLHESVGSTLDVAHDLAQGGAPAGTLVLADRQTAGRGQQGRRWTSHPGVGIWLTLVERPNDPAAVEVLSLRLGLRAAAALDRFADLPVALKWPNDLYLGKRKLAGTLVEARWRGGRPEWVAVGFGINVVAPEGVERAAGLASATRRIEVLGELVPALRAAATARGPLSEGELVAYAERDLAGGRACTSPATGTVAGITPTGELLVDTADGPVAFRGGSLVLDAQTLN